MTSTIRSWVKTDLSLDIACWPEFEGRDVASESGGVGAGGGKEVFPAIGEEDNIGAVHGLGIWNTLKIVCQ